MLLYSLRLLDGCGPAVKSADINRTAELRIL